MRKGLILSLGLLILGALSAQAQGVEFKPRIVFLLFVPQNIEATPYMDSIPTLLSAAVTKKNFFEIVEKKRVEKTLELEGYKLTSLNTNQMVAIGNKHGFDYIVFGNVKKERGIIFANIKILDIRHQTIYFEHTLTTTEGGLPDQVGNLANQIVEKTKNFISAGAAKARAMEMPPDPPSQLRVQSGTKKIRLSWSHNAPQTLVGFKVYRTKKYEERYILLSSVCEMTCADENPVLNEPLLYRVKAVGKNGQESEFSEVVEAITVAGPPPPIFLSIEGDIKKAYLKWRSYPGGGVWRFRIYRQQAPEKEFKEIAEVSAATTDYTDKGLLDGTTYSYALSGVNVQGVESDVSNPLEIKTVKEPDGVRAEGGKIRRITIGWNAHPFAGIAGYNLYKAEQKDGAHKLLAKIGNRMTVTYTDVKGLGDAATYWYKVSAFNKEGVETDLSEAVSATTRGIPPVPEGLKTKEREPRMVSLRWPPVKSPEDEIRGYYIYRSTEEKGEYQRIAHIKDPGVDSYRDKDPALRDNTTYYYKVCSYNSAGMTSDLSEPIPATTKNTPATPSGLKAQSGEVKKVTLTWEPNPEKDIREYVVFRDSAGGKGLKKIPSLKGKTVYVDSGLNDGTTYSYTVRAIDEDNLASEPPKPVMATTKPRPKKPTGLRMIAKEGQRTLQWDSNAEKDIKQYVVYKRGPLGISQKISIVTDISWTIDERSIKKGQRLFVTAVDETGLESEGSDQIVTE
ncbi:MAG: hypothetical protein HY882_05755 [Deltaproteobacteria bacterium]|nr:hypothetical protein [Deltaproteobacteria bacterium]